jgi:hypothetical protein
MKKINIKKFLSFLTSLTTVCRCNCTIAYRCLKELFNKLIRFGIKFGIKLLNLALKIICNFFPYIIFQSVRFILLALMFEYIPTYILVFHTVQTVTLSEPMIIFQHYNLIVYILVSFFVIFKVIIFLSVLFFFNYTFFYVFFMEHIKNFLLDCLDSVLFFQWDRS